jgi:hypothetical protein
MSTMSRLGLGSGGIIDSMYAKRVLQSKKLVAQKIWVEYLQFQGGDFRPHTAIKLLYVYTVLYRSPHHGPTDLLTSGRLMCLTGSQMSTADSACTAIPVRYLIEQGPAPFRIPGRVPTVLLQYATAC